MIGLDGEEDRHYLITAHRPPREKEPIIQKKRLGDLLVQNGVIAQPQLDAALTRQRETGQRLGEVLIGLGYVTESQIFRVLADQLGLPHVDPETVPADPEILLLIPETLARKYMAIPLQFEKKRLVVAMADPIDYDAIKDLVFCSGSPIQPVLATRRAVADAIDARYARSSADRQEATVESIVEESSAQFDEAQIELVPEISLSPEETRSLSEGSHLAPIVRLANLILTKAVKLHASDVHIEPEKRDVRVRFRVDGHLREDMRVPKWVHGALVSRIKVLAKLDIAERRMPQDGAVRVLVDRQEMDLRISVVSTQHGEKVVIRVLNQSAAPQTLESFGMSARDQEMVASLLRHRKGLIVVTGPTGSGKTTTLFGMIQRLKSPAVNIATVEDPVEYQLEGVNQMQVNADIGLTFATCLRAILRQDPDIILIGEIRDAETAQIALRAAMTGHLVLSTVHTNDAPATLSRLVDLGVPRFLVASQVVGIIAQRLVRQLCARCKEVDTPRPEDLLALKIPLDAAQGLTPYRAKGCPACVHTGYTGRIGLYEILGMTSALRELVTNAAPDHEIQREALAGGMVTLFQDGIEKVRDGSTSIEELLRVVEVEGMYETVCVQCHGVLHSDFLTCPICGISVANRCHQCGKTLRAGWSFCPRCRRKDDHQANVVAPAFGARRGRRAANH